MPLSTKEINYLKDYLSWELLAAKTCHNHAQNLKDNNLKQLFDDVGNIHQQNFMHLLNYTRQQAGEGGM